MQALEDAHTVMDVETYQLKSCFRLRNCGCEVLLIDESTGSISSCWALIAEQKARLSG